MRHWLHTLADPPATFRGAPFWAWNGRIGRAEVRRQVREFRRAGFGGFFIHVRSGLQTPYLSAAFLDSVRTAVAEAKRLGLEAWLYDEDRWSSGFGGGRVTANPAYRAQALVWEAVAAESFQGPPADALRCFTARLDGIVARDVRPLSGRVGLSAGRSVLIFRVVSNTGHPWYNFTSYVDVMNPAAVRAFLRCTHEVYRKAVGSEFGKTIPGIFTDEPNYGGCTLPDREHARAYPWTGRLAGVFRRRKGYDLLDRLVEISHRVDGRVFSQVRQDYRQVCTELFVEAYSRQIGAWCRRNRLELTGHVMAESDLEGQADRVGACMPHYEWFQRPGIDILSDKAPELLAAKQAVSVAAQLGRKRVLSEIFGCTGWDATFAMYKHIGDWHQVLGINHFCPHLSWYSMEGDAKRDYPASIFRQSPWWPDHRLLGDYAARLSLALTHGDPCREVCVIHPIESVWGLHIKKQGWIASGHTEMLEQLCGRLLDQQFDFDFADESLLARYGAVQARDACLAVGRMRYRAVVVAEAVTLRASTVRLLEQFVAAGGKLVFFGKLPERVDGRPSRRLQALAARATCATPGDAPIAAALGEACRHVRVTSTTNYPRQPRSQVWVHLRKAQDGEVLFVVNMDRVHAKRARIAWDGAAGRRVQEIDAADGSRRDIDTTAGSDGGNTWIVDLPPEGSRLYWRSRAAARVRPPAPATVENRRIRLAGEWDYRLDEPNALTLDTAAFRVLASNAPALAGRCGLWQPETLLWQHEAELRRACRYPSTCVQPYLARKSPAPGAATVEIRYTFEVEEPPRGDVRLALEHPERCAITLNGRSVPNRADGWFVDPAIRTVPLGAGTLRRGRNVLGLTTVYRHDSRLEDVYLIGAFGVRLAGLRPAVTTLPARLAIGDWCGQGLAMYSGAVTYSQVIKTGARPSGSRAVLCLDRPQASVIRVAVNGRSVRTIGWAPWEIDITRDLRPRAANRIAISVVSSRRNLLGPLHHVCRRPLWVGPEELRPAEDKRIPGYSLVPYGLLGEVWISERSCVVPASGDTQRTAGDRQEQA